MNLKKLFGGDAKQAAQAEKLIQDRVPSRRQHYVFVHKLLPHLAFSMGAEILFLLNEPERAGRFLREVWEDAAAMEDLPPGERIAPEPLGANVVRAGEKLLAILVLPPPITSIEAHFAAILSDVPPEPGELSEAEYSALLRLMPLRYFTLEAAQNLQGQPLTMFCEWTSEGRHLNRGDGPPPDEAAWFHFLAAQDFPPARASVAPGDDGPIVNGE